MILIFILSLLVEIKIIRFVKKADSHTQIDWDEIEAPKEDSVIEDQTIHEENINEEKTDE
jgi:UDP-N-acetylglucosamine pyrophosphorylase